MLFVKLGLKRIWVKWVQNILSLLSVSAHMDVKYCTCVQPLRNSARKPAQPLDRASMPSRVIWSHHDRFSISSILQPSLHMNNHSGHNTHPGKHAESRRVVTTHERMHVCVCVFSLDINTKWRLCEGADRLLLVCGCYLRALREWLLMDTQEVRSKCLSLEQNLLRLRQVLSVILVQPFRFNTSMFLQFCANVLGNSGTVNRETVNYSWAASLYK